MAAASEACVLPPRSLLQVVEVLSSVGFTPQLQSTPVGSLSGGWKMKLALGERRAFATSLVLFGCQSVGALHVLFCTRWRWRWCERNTGMASLLPRTAAWWWWCCCRRHRRRFCRHCSDASVASAAAATHLLSIPASSSS